MSRVRYTVTYNSSQSGVRKGAAYDCRPRHGVPQPIKTGKNARKNIYGWITNRGLKAELSDLNPDGSFTITFTTDDGLSVDKRRSTIADLRTAIEKEDFISFDK